MHKICHDIIVTIINLRSHFCFPASGQAVVLGVVPSPPRYVSLTRIGSSIPTARRLSSNVAISRVRAFRESICEQEKVHTNFIHEYALGGTRTHEIDL